MTIHCYSCDKELEFTPFSLISRQEECDFCQKDLHCCKMCFFYDPHVYNECHESQAEKIREKEKANFCDYFRLKERKTEDEHKKHINAAHSLFKK